ncbi:MAG: PadR family transcriptional regulator, partial [Proteobacteria bacterium]|nr:PadR family transcriptional regulator [Pseudomonadota bacterium]
LGVLTQGEASGYDIKKHFECVFSHFYVAGFGSIYPALTDLARDGLVTCREEAQVNRPGRKVYALTPAGRALFEKELVATPPQHRVRSEFFVLLHFAHLLPPERLRAVLDERLGDVTRMVNELERILERFDDRTCDAGYAVQPAHRFEVELALVTARAHRDYIASHRAALLKQVGTTQPERARA